MVPLSLFPVCLILSQERGDESEAVSLTPSMRITGGNLQILLHRVILIRARPLGTVSNSNFRLTHFFMTNNWPERGICVD